MRAGITQERYVGIEVGTAGKLGADPLVTLKDGGGRGTLAHGLTIKVAAIWRASGCGILAIMALAILRLLELDGS